MALAPATRLGPYEILQPIGAGGMGEVYRARDTRLERIVAVKILPAHLSSDPVRKQRFEREAKTISSLNHPHICTLYDVGQQDGVDFLVMECVEGEALSKRLEKGPLPLEQVFKFGAQIADALYKAHRAGIVHRDLKPGNIMIAPTGAKLLDFGLAKPAAPASGMTLTAAATQTTPVTQEGMVVGTFQYMSPEQIEGKEVDGQSDIFSLGAVLYEMVTAKKAFQGRSQLSVASAILEKEPAPITTIKPMTPPALDHAIRRCLAKDPEDRWQSARDLALELEWIITNSSRGGAVPGTSDLRRNARERLAWGTILAVLLAVVVWSLLENRFQPRVVRAFLPAPEGATFDFVGDSSGPPVVSSDGTRIAFCAHINEVSSIWVQSLDTGAARKLDGTEKASAPFWSPDAAFIGFFANGKLKKISSSGGAATVLADAPNPRGGSWSRDNIILYAPNYRGELWRINASGGTPQRATELDSSKHTTHRWPSFLPDGKHFLYYATNHIGGRAELNGIYFASLDSDAAKLVLATDSAGQYAAGRLLFHSQIGLIAQKFDARSGTLSGEPVTMADELQYDTGTWHSSFTASENGVLVYEPGVTSPGLDLVWLNNAGKQLGTVGERAAYQGFRLSPDGKRLAVALGSPRPNIWVHDLVRGVRTQLTFDQATHSMLSWSRDGQRIVFIKQTGSPGTNTSEIQAVAADGSAPSELLLRPDQSVSGFSWPQWSPDGRYLLFLKASGPSGASIWAMPTSGEKKPFLVAQPQNSQANIEHTCLSPDGRWLAYTSTDSGRLEVYVTRFPNGAGRWQVSQDGGAFPVWRADSREIYFFSYVPPVRLLAAQVNTKGEELQIENVRPLFPGPGAGAAGQIFDVTPDGKRFLVPLPPSAISAPLALVLNWTAELKKK
jgi:eukaryotic-like serine/threonine-protein kinase